MLFNKFLVTVVGFFVAQNAVPLRHLNDGGYRVYCDGVGRMLYEPLNVIASFSAREASRRTEVDEHLVHRSRLGGSWNGRRAQSRDQIVVASGASPSIEQFHIPAPLWADEVEMPSQASNSGSTMDVRLPAWIFHDVIQYYTCPASESTSACWAMVAEKDFDDHGFESLHLDPNSEVFVLVWSRTAEHEQKTVVLRTGGKSRDWPGYASMALQKQVHLPETARPLVENSAVQLEFYR
jgi:hypothetical protein